MNHARSVFVLLALSLPAAAVSAQPATPPADAVGVKVGLNVAHVVENTRGLDSKLGLTFGAYFRRGFSEHFALQPEALFSQQGTAFRDISLRLSYLQIPVLGVATFTGKTTSPFVAFGPALGLKLGASYSQDGISGSISDEVAALDFGFVLGGGIELEKLLLEVRYLIGLKDVDVGSDIDKNRVFSLRVGCRFR